MSKLAIYYQDRIFADGTTALLPSDSADALCYVRHIDQQILLANIGPSETQGFTALGRLTDFTTTGDGTFAVVADIRTFPHTIEWQMFGAVAGSMAEISEKDFQRVIAKATGMDEGPSSASFVTRDRFSAELATLCDNRCCFSGVQTEHGAAFIIWPIEQGGSWHLSNFLFLDPEIGELFAGFAWTVGPSLELILDVGALSADIAYTVNRTGRLMVPDNATYRPARDALAWHFNQFTRRIAAGRKD